MTPVDTKRLREASERYANATVMYHKHIPGPGTYKRGTREHEVLDEHGRAQHAFDQLADPATIAALCAELEVLRDVLRGAKLVHESFAEDDMPHVDDEQGEALSFLNVALANYRLSQAVDRTAGAES